MENNERELIENIDKQFLIKLLEALITEQEILAVHTNIHES